MGPRCEQAATQIDIAINLTVIPPSIIIHFITAFENKKHERTTTFKKVPFDQSSTTFFISQPFNLIFIEIFGTQYLAVRREKFIPFEQISAEIRSDCSCPNITELFNATTLAHHNLRRLKYYQLPCRERSHVRLNQSFREHLRIEFKQHKHLFISPCILIVLALPRLVIAFLSGCMKSGRDPWVFIAGYYISFVPPILIFIVFILPSEKYKQNFVTTKTAL
jgi:hypothetical protein